MSQLEQTTRRLIRATGTRNGFLRVLQAAVTLGLTGYLIWRVNGDLSALRPRIERPAFLALALLLALAAAVASARLWHSLIPASGRPPFGQLLAYYLLGLLCGNFLPTVLGGDAVRAAALGAAVRRPGQAVGSVLMTRVVGLWSAVGLAAITLPWYIARVGWPAAWLVSAIGVLALAATCAGSLLLLGSWQARLPIRLPAFVCECAAGLRAYRDRPGLLLAAFGWATAIQLSAVAINAATTWALGLSVSFGQLLVALPLINLVSLLPMSIGGFGLREGAYAYFLGLFGVTISAAVLLSLSVFVLLLLVSVLGGLVASLLIATPERQVQHEPANEAAP